MLRLFNRYFFVPAVISLVVESGLLVLSVWSGRTLRTLIFYGRPGEPGLPYLDSTFFLEAFVFTSSVLVVLYMSGMYDLGERLGRRQMWIRVLRSLLISFVILLLLSSITAPRLIFSRGALLITLVISATLLLGWRRLLAWFLKWTRFSGRILIVGADDSSIRLAREILAREHLGYRILGFLADDFRLQGAKLLNPHVVGTTDQVWDLAKANRATLIIVAQEDKRGRLDMDSLLKCKNHGIPVQEASSFTEQLTGRIPLGSLRISWLLFSGGFVVSPATKFLKRGADILISLILLTVAAPLMLFVALAIRLDSSGPSLYRQERIGFRGRHFTLLKFRSMGVDAEASGEPQWARSADPRVTRIGRWLRLSHFDELPQLFNVLVGDMSLVGPRPEREVFVERLRLETPFYDQRHMVRPGITGWAQIMSPYAANVQKSIEKLEYDLFYVKNLSFLLDLSIVISTVRTLLLARGAR